MPAIDPLSPEIIYALKGNIKLPTGNQAAATAAEGAANARLADAVSPTVVPTLTIPPGTIKLAN